ncbi:MAG: hypothetical protein ACOX6D_00800 [Thermoguttaceae bacterium]
MFRNFLFNWLSARCGEEVKSRFYEAAAEALRDAPAAESSETTEDTGKLARAEVGLLFARGAEYGCLTDRLENIVSTKGNGLKFTQGTYRGIRLAIAETGDGEQAARDGTLALLQVFNPRRVIAAGFAAALVPGIEWGEVYFPDELVSSDGDRCDLTGALLPAPEENNRSEEHPEESDFPFKTAPMVSVSKLPTEPNERRTLGEKYAACLADTTAFQVAMICRRASVPFLAVKAVVDRCADEPPADLRRAAAAGKEGAARRLGALLGTFTNRPSSLLDVYKIKERQLVTADRLADTLAELFLRTSNAGSRDGTDGRRTVFEE